MPAAGFYNVDLRELIVVVNDLRVLIGLVTSSVTFWDMIIRYYAWLLCFAKRSCLFFIVGSDEPPTICVFDGVISLGSCLRVLPLSIYL